MLKQQQQALEARLAALTSHQQQAPPDVPDKPQVHSCMVTAAGVKVEVGDCIQIEMLALLEAMPD